MLLTRLTKLGTDNASHQREHRPFASLKDFGQKSWAAQGGHPKDLTPEVGGPLVVAN